MIVVESEGYIFMNNNIGEKLQGNGQILGVLMMINFGIMSLVAVFSGGGEGFITALVSLFGIFISYIIGLSLRGLGVLVENSQKQKEYLEEIKNMLSFREDSFSCQDKDEKTNLVNGKELEREV